MGRISFFDEDKTGQPSQGGSTIPRVIRMGAVTPVQDAPKVEQTNTRGAPRFVPHNAKTLLTVGTGKRLDARIINVSASAVAVEADFSVMAPSSVTMVGSHPVKPGRKITLGAVFLFLKPIPPEICNETIVI